MCLYIINLTVIIEPGTMKYELQDILEYGRHYYHRQTVVIEQ